MFKKLSHILTAFLFYHLSVGQHPVFCILFNINETIPKVALVVSFGWRYRYHVFRGLFLAVLIFSEHDNFLLCRNPYGPHRPHIRYTLHPHIQEAAYFSYPELPHIPLLLQPEYIFPSG